MWGLGDRHQTPKPLTASPGLFLSVFPTGKMTLLCPRDVVRTHLEMSKSLLLWLCGPSINILNLETNDEDIPIHPPWDKGSSCSLRCHSNFQLQLYLFFPLFPDSSMLTATEG